MALQSTAVSAVPVPRLYSEAMLNTPWETGSPLYRRLVVVALSVTGAGILMVILGAVTNQQIIMYLGLPVIVVGMSAHLSGMVVRARDARRRMKGNK